MATYVVVGLQYGDEGKGKLPDVLSAKLIMWCVFKEVIMQVIPFMWATKNLFCTFFRREFCSVRESVLLRMEWW